MENIFSLAGKKALVTGARTGIGQAIAVGLAKACECQEKSEPPAQKIVSHSARRKVSHFVKNAQKKLSHLRTVGVILPPLGG